MSDCAEVRMSSYKGSFLSLILSSLNLVVAQFDGRNLEIIPKSVHNVGSIDSVSGMFSVLILRCAGKKQLL